MYASLLMKTIKSQEKINRGVNEVINAASVLSVGVTRYEKAMQFVKKTVIRSAK